MKKTVLAMILLAGSALAGPRVRVGIGFGAPAPVAVVRPACPGAGYVWIDGYYAPSGIWTPGFWRAPEVRYAVAPRVVRPHYFAYDRHRSGYDHGRESHREFHR
jgi:hypothetical protein